jgi:NAD(P)-dependent dehydrogenase (short-subunit alcohol dehydrogenase family)
MTTKVALVTAAGSGMGAAVARNLAGKGWRVAVSSSSEKAVRLAEEIGGFGQIADSHDPDAMERFVAAAAERFGRIDALVNSAAHGPKGSVLEISDADWRRGMDVYLLAAVRAVRLVAPHLERAGGGAIVNISSFAAVEPDPNFPTSAVFRAGLSAYVKLAADLLAPKRIRVNKILPGFIDSLPERPGFREAIPMGRYGRVDEIAETAAFLLSDGGAYITGQNIRVDGGLTRSV